METHLPHAPGKYCIGKDSLPVNAEFSRTSPVVTTLAAGMLIDVVEVPVHLDDGRVRARLADPVGWISLRSGNTLFAWPESEEAPLLPGCASWQRTSLMIAARHGQADVIARALETSCAQPQLDMVDSAGNTALMIAAREGHVASVEVLSGAGADLSIANVDGSTAADLASTDEVRKVVQNAEKRYDMLVAAAVMPGGYSSAAPAVDSASSNGAGNLPFMLASITAEAATMAIGDALGKFVIVHESVPVNEEFSRVSAKLSVLPKGTIVDVVELPLKPDDGRVRARIAEPAGWISLRSGKNIFARPDDS